MINNITVSMMLLRAFWLVAALLLPTFLAEVVSARSEAGYGIDRLIHGKRIGSNLLNIKRQLRLDPYWEVVV
ncbi:MAG: hypothetical protein ACRDAX_02460 [Propionibacteriaceae bacterium]